MARSRSEQSRRKGRAPVLNALSRFIPEEERIITIEDTAELQLQQRHVIKFETRPPNLNKEGGINQRILLRTALRMRPDRIIVGECRGAEALDMLQAMNTGVEGSMSTVTLHCTQAERKRRIPGVRVLNCSISSCVTT